MFIAIFWRLFNVCTRIIIHTEKEIYACLFRTLSFSLIQLPRNQHIPQPEQITLAQFAIVLVLVLNATQSAYIHWMCMYLSLMRSPKCALFSINHIHKFHPTKPNYVMSWAVSSGAPARGNARERENSCRQTKNMQYCYFVKIIQCEILTNCLWGHCVFCSYVIRVAVISNHIFHCHRQSHILCMHSLDWFRKIFQKLCRVFSRIKIKAYNIWTASHTDRVVLCVWLAHFDNYPQFCLHFNETIHSIQPWDINIYVYFIE